MGAFYLLLGGQFSVFKLVCIKHGNKVLNSCLQSKTLATDIKHILCWQDVWKSSAIVFSVFIINRFVSITIAHSWEQGKWCRMSWWENLEETIVMTHNWSLCFRNSHLSKKVCEGKLKAMFQQSQNDIEEMLWHAKHCFQRGKPICLPLLFWTFFRLTEC